MGLFNRIDLETPESVELEFTLAGIGNRAYALCIDYLILGSSLVIILITGAFLFIYIADVAESLFIGGSDKVGLWLFAIQSLSIFFTYVGYFVFFETIWQGQTPGKRWIKIRVICDNGTRVGLVQSTLRALIRPIDDFFFIGSFLIILGKREKRLGDLVAGTMVIREGLKKAQANFPIAPEAKTLADKIKQESDISRLLPEDFALIREYLQRRQQMIPEARRNISIKLGHRIKDTIGLEAIAETVTSDLFLEAVYLAYQAQYHLP